MTSLRARTSALAAATLVGALAVSGSAITAQAATTALSPASGPIDCPTAYPLSAVKDGIQGIGWTVSKGTAPERFDANVLGVLKDGVGYGFDVILAEVSSPALTKAGGVWAGMSGSPVYAPDGRLLGAVAYTLTYGPSLIAGITPAEDMMPLGASTAAAAKATAQAQARLAAKPQVSLPSAMQQRLKAEGVSSAAAASGLRRLQVPVWVSGMQGKFQQKLVDKLASRGLDARVGGSTSTGTATPGSQIHAGGNFAAALSTGSVTLGGVGTTTFVCNGRAVAFGHPMTGVGPVSFPALAADVVTVVSDPTGSPFKAANFGGVVGTLDKDTVSGISAKLDAMPTGGTQVISVIVGPDGKNRRLASTVYDSSYGAYVAANQIYAAGLKTLGGDAPGTGTLNLAISGVRANGSAFMYTRSDKLSAGAGESLPYALGDQVFGFAGALVGQDLEDVTITKITMTSKITSVPSGLKFSGLSYKKGSTWIPVSDMKTPTIQPGTLTLRAVVGPQKGASGSPVSQEFPITIPDTLAGDYLDVFVEGGVDPYSIDLSGASSFDQLLAQLRKLPSSTTLKVTVNAESLSKPIVLTSTLPGPVTPFASWSSFQVAGGDDSAKG